PPSCAGCSPPTDRSAWNWATPTPGAVAQAGTTCQVDSGTAKSHTSAQRNGTDPRDVEPLVASPTRICSRAAAQVVQVGRSPNPKLSSPSCTASPSPTASTRSPEPSHPQDGGGYATSSPGAAPTLRWVRWVTSGDPQ